MKALRSGLVGLAVVLAVVGLAASTARAGHWQVRVGFSRPAVSCVPRTLPWRTGPVLVSPLRQVYRAGYREAYAVGLRGGIRAPVVVRRAVVSYGPVSSYRVIRWGPTSGCYGPSGGLFFTIRR